MANKTTCDGCGRTIGKEESGGYATLVTVQVGADRITVDLCPGVDGCFEKTRRLLRKVVQHVAQEDWDAVRLPPTAAPKTISTPPVAGDMMAK